MVRGEGSEVIAGVTPQQVFDFVLDPALYTKADTKILWVTRLADIPNGMIAREDGTFLGMRRLRGSVITRYVWKPPHAIDVTLEHDVAPREICLSAVSVPEGVEIAVQDRGPGVASEALGRLFTPFFTTKVHGTGLGLASSRAIAEAHSGSIGFENLAGGGACFSLRLPAATSDGENPQ